MRLCENLPKNKNYKVFLDNHFSSIDLAIHLKSVGILSVGVIRSNRMKGCPLKSKEQLKKENI